MPDRPVSCGLSDEDLQARQVWLRDPLAHPDLAAMSLRQQADLPPAASSIAPEVETAARDLAEQRGLPRSAQAAATAAHPGTSSSR